MRRRCRAASILGVLWIGAGAAQAQPRPQAVPAVPAPPLAPAPPVGDSLAALRARVDALTAQGQASAAEAAALRAALDERDKAIAAQRETAAADAAALRAEIAALRAKLDGVPAAGGGPSLVHDHGFTLATADRRYALNLDGYLQERYTAYLHKGSIEDGGFALRRARLITSGALGDAVSFRIMTELAREPLLLDAYADLRIVPSLTVRAGRDKVPFTRSALTPAQQLAFPDRPLAVDGVRWGRDLGVQLRYAGPSVAAQLGVGNGAVDGATDKVPAVSARVQWSVTGPVIEGTDGMGVPGSDTGQATLGLGGVIDAVTPTTISGIVIDADADNDGKPGRVLVQGVGGDIIIRSRSFEAVAEFLYRHEDWSGIARANPELSAKVGADRRRRFAAAYADAVWLILPGRLSAGARIGWSDLPFLSMYTTSVLPRGKSVIEMSSMVTLYQRGRRLLGASYSLLRWKQAYGEPSSKVYDQQLIVEAQLNL